ncbi:specifically androgen-regulated gene protein [Amia ocellicauda]|uniref:specifically androgen-regulated gene protein n=1 Tax=Amia ocellicauda TaxID=2972642 RepID=UPI0034649BF6
MPKSDTWLGGVSMESIASVDSAGSCDSVVSMNSSFSDDSLEHLSAEERACLMFLEETIESLEAEEDSGLSNDEPDQLPTRGNLAAKKAHLSSSMGKSQLSDVSKYPYEDPVTEVGKENKPILNYLVPTPLVLANGGSIIQAKSGKGKESSAVLPNSKGRLTEPGSSLRSPTPEYGELKKKQDKKPTISVTGSRTSHDHSMIRSEMNSEVIPPPTDFRDNPEVFAVKEGPENTLKPLSRQDQPVGKPEAFPLRGPLSYDGLEKMRQRASLKKAPQSSPDPKEKAKLMSGLPAPEEKINKDVYSLHSDTHANSTPLHVPPEPKSPPPVVAPKPKKLPSNIVVMTNKPPGPSHEFKAGEHHLSSSPTERAALDPQKVRMEALKKLGLLKPDEMDSGPILNPTQSQRLRRSLEPQPTSTPALPYDLKHQPTTALRDSKEPINGLQVGNVNQQRSGSSLPPVSTRPSPARLVGIKSATLERSGMGLGSYMASQHADPDLVPDKSLLKPSAVGPGSPAHLRNSRPRPASLGTGKDFMEIQGGKTKSAEPKERSSLQPASQQHLPNRMPRSQGISVQITPRGKTGEDRMEALRKLGLLKD